MYNLDKNHNSKNKSVEDAIETFSYQYNRLLNCNGTPLNYIPFEFNCTTIARITTRNSAIFSYLSDKQAKYNGYTNNIG